MLNLFLLIAVSIFGIQKERLDHLEICKSVEKNSYCDSLKVSVEKDRKELEEKKKELDL